MLPQFVTGDSVNYNSQFSAACQKSIGDTLPYNSTCTNLRFMNNRRKMLVDETATIIFNILSSNPNIRDILDAALTLGAVSKNMADIGYPNYKFTATSLLMENTGSNTNTAISSSSSSDSSNSSSTIPSSGMIAGVVIGVLAALAIGGFVFFNTKSNF